MIPVSEYQARRQALALELPPDSIAVIPAAKERLRNGDAHYRFRQDSDFYYLTGFNEPDALLCITSGPNSNSILFNRPHNAQQEQWDGQRLGQNNAPKILGVDMAYAIERVPQTLPELLADCQAVCYSIGRDVYWDNAILKAWQTVKQHCRRGQKAPDSFHDLSTLISEMRLLKSEAELKLMQTAAAISVDAHQRAMRHARKADYEYELEAELLYEFTRQGCRSVAYDSIVASGNQACILHYTQNNQPLCDGTLVLIDAGGEFENYASDITRTFPVNGCFNAEQRAIYTLVLKAQRAAISKLRPGALWSDCQTIIIKALTEGLVDLGILQGQVDELIVKEAYKRFYMHQSGHWLGLDVHDSGLYKKNNKSRRLEPGMVLTVEPGIYIPKGMEGVHARWQGIGIRIEDDVKITDKGCEVLTAGLVSDPDDIEAMVRG